MATATAKKKINWKKYLSPISIPEGKSGKVMVVHEHRPANSPVMLCNARCAFMGGYRKSPPAMNVEFPFDTTWHRLQEEEQGTWTSDLPCEQFQQEDNCHGFRGRILLGGLGLGVIAAILSKKTAIKEIVAVEVNADVIKLVQPHLNLPKLKVIQADLFDYLKTTKDRYDYAFFDIWQSDGEWTLSHAIYPLQKLARGIGLSDSNVRSWNFNIMAAQVFSALQNALLLREAVNSLPPKTDYWQQWYVEEKAPRHYLPFIRFMKKRRPSLLTEKENYLTVAREYAYGFGTECWETIFEVKSPQEVQAQDLLKEPEE